MASSCRVVSFLFLLVIVFSFFSFFVVSIPGLAGDNEIVDIDEFNTLPNYRYENQSVTDSAVQEQVDGGRYEVYNAHNGTSGYQQFDKSRELNSRELGVESRFMLDVGGSEVSYYADVLGDRADFTERDSDGISFSHSPTYLDGMAKVRASSSWQGAFHDNIFVSAGVYHTFRCRIKPVDDDAKVSVWYYDETGALSYNSWGSTYSNQWYDIEETVPIAAGKQIKKISVIFNSQESEYDNYFYLDSWDLVGDLEHATHVEGGVEDTRDFMDSDEFFTDELGNASDFEDQTTDGWAGYEYCDVSVYQVNSGYWLNISTNTVSEDIITINNSQVYDDDSYEYVAVEVTNAATSGDAVDTVTFSDGSGNQLFQWTDDIAVNETCLIHGQFGADWTSADIELRIAFTFVTDSLDNELYMNFSYLYDAPRGDLEGLDHDGVSATGCAYVSPAGYVVHEQYSVGNGTGLYDSGLSIDTDVFDVLVIRARASVSSSYTFQDYGTSTVYQSFTLTTSWSEQTFQLDDDVDWTGIVIDFMLGHGTTGAHRLEVDYFFLLGNWSDGSQVKYSFLTEAGEEGLVFEFTREGPSGNYSLGIDMYDPAGVALSSSTSFSYGMSSDGWLYFELLFDVDRKKIDFEFMYENGTAIVDVDGLTDLYDSVGLVNLLLVSGDGFPSLCLNVTQGSLARGYLLVDYIISNNRVQYWHELADSENRTFERNVPLLDNTVTNQPVSSFTSASPFGVSVHEVSTSMNDARVYYLDVDHFDGMSYDVDLRLFGVDTSDYAQFYFEAYNVQSDGSLLELFRLEYYGVTGATPALSNAQVMVFDADHDKVNGDILHGSGNCTGRVSLARLDGEQVELQYSLNNGEEEFASKYTARGNYTREFVFFFTYEVVSGVSASGNMLDLMVNTFELVRKDWLQDVVGAILSPFQFIIGIFVAFLYMIFLMLATVVMGVGQAIIETFKPLINTLGTYLGTILNIVSGGLESIIASFSTIANDIWQKFTSILTDIYNMIAGIVVGVINQLISQVGSLLDAAIAWLTDIAADLFVLITKVIFYWWDAFNLPNLITLTEWLLEPFVYLVTNAPTALDDIMTLVNWWSLAVLANVMFAFLVLVPLVVSSSWQEALRNFGQLFMFDVTFGMSVLGFKVKIPYGVVTIFLVSLTTLEVWH